MRAKEAHDRTAEGYEPMLKHSRWPLLTPRQNLPEAPIPKLIQLPRFNPSTGRATCSTEDCQIFWHYVSPHRPGCFLAHRRTLPMHYVVQVFIRSMLPVEQ